MPIPELPAALFIDLDDTLVAFDAVTDSTWREVWAEFAVGRPGLDEDLLYQTVRQVSEHYWSDPERHRVGRLDIRIARRNIVSEGFALLGLPEMEAIAAADRYSSLRLERMYLFPGATGALEFFRARGIFLVLITNGDSAGQRWKINRFGLEPYFDAILVEGERGYGKPDPRIYRDALAAAACSPGQALMIGDNYEWDVLGALSAGIRAVWIDRAGNGTVAVSRASSGDPATGGGAATADSGSTSTDCGTAPNGKLKPEAALRSFSDLPAHLVVV